MRICFSIKNDTSDEMKLTEHFGESARFVIFDTEKETFAMHARHPVLCRGQCQCHLPTVHGREFDAVICRSIGIRAFAMLRRNRIDVFVTQENQIDRAIKVWKSRNLCIVNRGVCRPEVVAWRRKQREQRARKQN